MGYAEGMNDRDAIAKVHEIVDRYPLPDFVLGYDVRLGDIDGDPALWVVFHVTPGPNQIDDEMRRRIADMDVLEAVIRPELLLAFEERFPYFRYEPVPAASTAA